MQDGAGAPGDAANRNRDTVAFATVAFDEWRFLADKDGALLANGEWLQPGFDDSAWKTLAPAPWNLLDESLRDYHGTGLYRARFTPPGTPMPGQL